MEYEKIKQLMDDMGNSKLTSLDIEFPDGIKIKMEKNNGKQVVVTNLEEQIVKEEFHSNSSNISKDEQKEITEEGNIVKSPMIGTFYMKPSPDSNPYVEVGSIVKKGTVLCIIEAMKLMNEIESEYEGKIVEILVKDGETVDYGKPLFRIV
jgi:acetyl-CoA carboxylase biotin carboxyl carrier protein